MIKITSKGPSGAHCSSFEVIENTASGDCLYLSTLEFMHRHKSFFNEMPIDVANLRRMVVTYLFAKNAVCFRSNWDRFSDNILFNLHNQLPILLDNDPSKEKQKQDAYEGYTCHLGNDGTLVELTLIAEMFSFNCTVVRRIDETKFNCFDICASNNGFFDTSRPQCFFYFTGSSSSGYFRYLNPVKGKKPLCIESGQYVLTADTFDRSLISITNRIVKAAETTPTISNNLIPCPHCPIATRKSFRGQCGLKIHISKRHADLTVKAPDSQTEPMPLGDQLAQLKASNRLLLRIPKSARKSVAEQLANTVDNVVKLDSSRYADDFVTASDLIYEEKNVKYYQRMEEERVIEQLMQEEKYRLQQRYLDRKYEILLQGSDRGSSVNTRNRIATEKWVTRTSEFNAENEVDRKSMDDFEEDLISRLHDLRTSTAERPQRSGPIANSLGRDERIHKTNVQANVDNRSILSLNPMATSWEVQNQQNPDVMIKPSATFNISQGSSNLNAFHTNVQPSNFLASNKLRLLPNPKADHLNTLVKFALDVQNFAKTVQRKALDQFLSNPLLLEELVDKLPPSFKVDWAKYIVSIPNNRVTLMTLSDFMDQLLQVLVKITEYVPKDSTKNDKKQNKWNSERVNSHQDDKSGHKFKKFEEKKDFEKKCKICDKNCIGVENCTIFTSYEPAQRWKAIYDNKLCRKCLRKHGGLCRVNKECGVNNCVFKHHSLLHDDQKHKPIQNVKSAHKDVNDITELSNSHLYINPKVILRFIPIKAYGNGISIDTFAFLEEGSTATLIDQSLADSLKLVGVPKNLCLIWSAKIHRKEKNSQQFNLTISSIDNQTIRFKLREVKSVECLGIPPQRLNKEELCTKFAYLRDVPFANYENTVPGILIGCNNARIGVPRKVIDGDDYGPIAAKTLIGWTVHGPICELRSCEVNQINHYRVEECKCQHEHDESLHQSMKNYFSIDNFGIQVPEKLCTVSKDDEKTLQLMQNITKRIAGRFESGLLWRKNDRNVYPKVRVIDRIMGSNNQVRRIRVQFANGSIKWRSAAGVARLDISPGLSLNNSPEIQTGGTVAKAQ
ncbi:hypothetical protein Bhyg_12336 [Pseudolycoriella hygida]|uniref:Uncharacterized protein n=1 Tax=Pseudolycoriella hygida TaxID=35572 RepID=A0A9Q0MYD1_9DIPT|nr:hypothetical protein Bhyg_12336 [Pseudolycoriella hygida]